MIRSRKPISEYDSFHSLEKYPVNRGMTILSRAMVLIVLTLVLVAAAVRIPPETFDYSQYEDEIARFQTDIVVDPIDSSQDAIRAAVRLFHHKFGDEAERFKPYKAYYNEEHDVWLVRTKPPEVTINVIVFYRSGYCFIEGSTGRVLALYGEKA
ncbi:MAG: hypothetical protein II912_09670 [Clostridia bacterium]|nr:hypothetical protein [Clostridia bacterium]